MPILSILIAILILCVVVWAARALMAAFGVGDPIRTVVMVLLVILCLFWVLGFLGVSTPLNLR